jgi:hypothetical protein
MRICALLVIAACTDPAVEMHLVEPTPDETANFDVSCITAVDMRAFGNDLGDADHAADITTGCLDLPHAATSFADIAAMMHGKFDAPLPKSGLLGIELRGIAGHCNDADELDHEAIFYGGAPYTSNNIAVPMKPNISCNATTTYTVHALDLATAGACTPITNGVTYAADIRPAMMGPNFEQMFLDYGTSAAMPDASGLAQVSSYSKIAGAGCIAAGHQDDSDVNYGVSCIDTTTPLLCGGAPGTVEVGVMNNLIVGSIDTNLVTQFGDPVFGSVWDASGPAPHTAIAGATVTVDQGMQGQVVYAEPTAGTLTAHTGPTGTSGMFVVYGNGAIRITVSAPGHKSQSYIVAGSGQTLTNVIVALPPM